MLPPALDVVRSFLKLSRMPSPLQKALIAELEAISDILDAAEVMRTAVMTNVEKNLKGETVKKESDARVSGPLRCPCCGR